MKKMRVLLAALLAAILLVSWTPTVKAVQCGPAAKYTLYPVTKSCPLATLKFINKTGAPITLSMVGSKGTYVFTVPAGGNRFYSLPNGVYKYTATTKCTCGTKSGKITLTGRADWKWWCR